MAEDDAPSDAADAFAAARRGLLQVIEREVRWFGTGDGARKLDPRVVAALAKVPREQFVPPELAARAYDNRPLPIGHDQTISQPLIVAVMTHLLHLSPEARVLEIGTGSGYQTAILAELAQEVVTIEVVEDLATAAATKLEELGYQNIECRVGDGAAGCPERAPFDGIMVTAAAPSMPRALVEQLAPGGRLVIPLGRDPISQELLLLEKDARGAVHERHLFPVAFVPLTGAGQGGAAAY
jgi:protein-L-isoaspartate(D-aspartate) O-methyltransferase